MSRRKPTFFNGIPDKTHELFYQVFSAGKGFTDICRVLLQSGIELYSSYESKALEGAVECRSFETLDVLLQNGVKEHSFAKKDKTLFDFVLEKKWMEAVKLLLKRGNTPSQKESFRLAFLAVGSKDAELYKLMEHLDLNIREKDEDGLTPLDRAIEYQDVEAVRIMCKDYPTIDYKILTRNFEKLKNQEITELLLDVENNHLPHIVDDAVDCGNYELIKWYYENIKDKEEIKNNAHLPLIRAIDRGFVDISMFFVNLNADKYYKCALMRAVSSGKEEIIRRMLEQGFSPDTYYDEWSRQSILQGAIMKRNVNISKLLIQNGAALDMKDCRGRTALHWAVLYENCEIIKLLLDHGATIDFPTVHRYTVLHFAVVSGEEKEEVFELLLRYGADVNADSEKNGTPLILAIANKKTVASKFLIKAIVEMKLDGQFVIDKNWKASKADVKLNGYQIQCEREMKILRGKKFVNSSLSYYSIKKIKDTDQLAALANNKNIFKVLKSSDFERKFPIYGRAIVEHFEKGVVRKRGLDRLNAMFFYVARRATDVLPKLPLTCIHQIFSYLSDEDAKNLTLL